MLYVESLRRELPIYDRIASEGATPEIRQQAAAEARTIREQIAKITELMATRTMTVTVAAFIR